MTQYLHIKSEKNNFGKHQDESLRKFPPKCKYICSCVMAICKKRVFFPRVKHGLKHDVMVNMKAIMDTVGITITT